MLKAGIGSVDLYGAGCQNVAGIQQNLEEMDQIKQNSSFSSGTV